MKRFFGKGKDEKKDKSPPSSEAAANAAAEELKQFTSPPSFSGWGAPSPPPAAPSPPAAGPPQVQAPLGYSAPPEPEPPAGRPSLGPPSSASYPASPSPAGTGFGGSPPGGAPYFGGGGGLGSGLGGGFAGPEPSRQAEGTEEEAVTEMALMDYAQRTGKRPEESIVRVDPLQAESMRDRALREYLERQKQIQRQREAGDLAAKAQAARARFAARAEPELPVVEDEPEEAELEESSEAFQQFASRFGMPMPSGRQDGSGSPRRPSRSKSKPSARKATSSKGSLKGKPPAKTAGTKPSGAKSAAKTAGKKIERKRAVPARPVSQKAARPKPLAKKSAAKKAATKSAGRTPAKK